MCLKRRIVMMGLGYVGLTLAVALGKITRVIAYDKNSSRISELKNGQDRNLEVEDDALAVSDLLLTSDPKELENGDFYIIAVPTPLNKNRQVDFSMLFEATKLVGKCLKKGDIVVYESSVYPGATEEQCIPLLEKSSKLICGESFSVGYSPERINPSDQEHVLQNIVKIVSATDGDTLNIISEVYNSIINAGVFPVSSIRVAEAAKVIENAQRDINIGFINDIAVMLHHLGIDTAEVIQAMKTKWNYIPFQPGLVGGHCIGINSYYLMHKAEEIGYYSNLIMAGRQINESIAKFIAEQTIKQLIRQGSPVKRARIAILGLTYKENCSDLRDTRVIDIIRELQSYDTELFIHDPIADAVAAKKHYGIELQSWENLNDLDAMIFTVSHQYYLTMDRHEIKNKLNWHGLIMDVKEIFNYEEFKDTGILLWRL
ncbi:TPA: nucleotide sugar dehydrogenase [Legionella pneumophila]|uniref:Nucleotide sugar dehydrogenase n=2 Tax=Legionella pneumophila TaxID=446 RepID=A0AAN5T261_LEGPN|nr:nucleotide sugar dehydrogenase [Legionella pneumophila]AEW51119.1 UDP-glucose/GDP-mannose dehydrogenase [Legionella pneumophila subsp. pneumophila ATCC 43290]AGN13732.1 UDP-N-acetyl-D-galactosamine dehydrogenase [Legionella pneumophila subsp. pneumophila str. Thunder Bay]MCZ4754699.1 nucleotide sugar dehydrogenase [Legionella pneumophila]MDW9029220.1 nucleotide sugar dehydrogenase [Legionella pneumophila]MDW9170908.1 nucleotide sugar dehydrogenase [Legionella pneumophila]